MFGTFAHNFNLSTLDLSYNQLRHIDFNIFTALTQLTHLKIDGNNLTEIPYADIKTHFPKLSLISLNDNDWNCTYLSGMIKSLKQNNLIVFIYNKMRIYNEMNVDGIRCVKNNTQHIKWTVPVIHLDDDDYVELIASKSPTSYLNADLVTGNMTKIWDKISEMEASMTRIDDAIRQNKDLVAIQREALTSKRDDQEHDIILQSEVGFIKIILCFMCFVMSIFVFISVVKFVRTYATTHRCYFPSDSLRRSTATIQTTMEHVM
jgi:hypothetical protein